jgi:hypothetical protein
VQQAAHIVGQRDKRAVRLDACDHALQHVTHLAWADHNDVSTIARACQAHWLGKHTACGPKQSNQQPMSSLCAEHCRPTPRYTNWTISAATSFFDGEKEGAE